MSTDSLTGVSLADALRKAVWDDGPLAGTVWVWFRANRDTLLPHLQLSLNDDGRPVSYSEMFDTLLVVAQLIGEEQ